jgi:hypothetical protein
MTRQKRRVAVDCRVKHLLRAFCSISRMVVRGYLVLRGGGGFITLGWDIIHR